MKKIGRQVCFIPAEGSSTRNGEGSFIKLKNGAILFGYTEFIDDNREDEAHAVISAFTSYDEGETWGEKRVLFQKSEGSVNIMSLSFLRMNNDDIGAFYIEKNIDGTDKLLFTRSTDEGLNWSKPSNCLDCIAEQDYYVLNNDRVIKLKNGRILFATARHSIYADTENFPAGEVCFFYSDNDGASWKKNDTELKCPFPKDPLGFQEPGLFQHDDHTLWCYIRTGLGFQFQAFSKDNGENWSSPEPNTFFSSPSSPMLVKNFKDLTLAVFNPIPEHILREDDEEFWGRTPYTLAVSLDNGKTFTKDNLFDIEDDLNNGYCYPAIIEDENYCLVAYYHSNNTDCCLNSTKIIKINYDEFTDC